MTNKPAMTYRAVLDYILEGARTYIIGPRTAAQFIARVDPLAPVYAWCRTATSAMVLFQHRGRPSAVGLWVYNAPTWRPRMKAQFYANLHWGGGLVSVSICRIHLGSNAGLKTLQGYIARVCAGPLGEGMLADSLATVTVGDREYIGTGKLLSAIDVVESGLNWSDPDMTKAVSGLAHAMAQAKVRLSKYGLFQMKGGSILCRYRKSWDGDWSCSPSRLVRIEFGRRLFEVAARGRGLAAGYRHAGNGTSFAYWPTAAAQPALDAAMLERLHVQELARRLDGEDKGNGRIRPEARPELFEYRELLKIKGDIRLIEERAHA